MAERIHVFWGILLTLLVAVAVWMVVSNVRYSRRIDHYHQQARQVGIGSDEELSRTVATLETELKERLDYETNVESDPLDLTKVIQSKKFLARLGLRESLEQQGRMRLSCTVVGPSESAVIKFLGRSYVVHTGDIFNGYRVDVIEPERVVLIKGGAQLVLINEKAPAGEIEELGGGRSGNF